MKLTLLLEEIEQKQLDALTASMAKGFNLMGAELKSKEDVLKQDVEQADLELNESITAASVIGMLLAAPKIVELVVKGFAGTISLFKRMFMRGGAKTEEQQIEAAKKIIQFTHKWHKKYIQGLKWILKVTGLFKKAGIQGEAAQDKATELIYHAIIAGLAVYSGIGSFKIFKQAIQAAQTVPAATSAVDMAQSAGDVAKLAKTAIDPSHNLLSLGALEAVMASVKTGEVAQFLSKLGLKS